MLRIDYSYMMAPTVTGGVDEAEWKGAEAQFKAAHDGFAALVGSGAVGFPNLPGDLAARTSIHDAVIRARGRYDDVVLLGIGGSALGPVALRSALRPPFWNE